MTEERHTDGSPTDLARLLVKLTALNRKTVDLYLQKNRYIKPPPPLQKRAVCKQSYTCFLTKLSNAKHKGAYEALHKSTQEETKEKKRNEEENFNNRWLARPFPTIQHR